MPANPRKQTPEATELVLEAHVRDIRPRIHRLLRVPGRHRLNQLHRVLQVAFGWEDYHLHDFQIGRWIFGDLETADDDLTYASLKEFEKDQALADALDSDFPARTLIDERSARLKDLLKPRMRFTYRYDFGDGWEIRILVREERPLSPGAFTECLDGARSGPPEDCGGVSGYAAFVKAIKNPRHPDHDEMRTWVGERYDPEGFDRDALNRTLAREFGVSKEAVAPPRAPEPYDPTSGPPRLEHYRIDRLNLREQMILVLGEGPATLEEVAARLEGVGTPLPHGLASLRKAWRGYPAIRQRLDGRLEVDPDRPELGHSLFWMSQALPREPRPGPAPTSMAPAPVDAATPLTAEELAAPHRLGVALPWSQSVRRRVILLLDARPEGATEAELAAALAEHQPAAGVVKALHPASTRGACFRRVEDGRLHLVRDDPEVVKLRQDFRTWWAEVRAASEEREAWAADDGARRERERLKIEEERRTFLSTRRGLMRLHFHGDDVAACVLVQPEGEVLRFAPGRRDELREALGGLKIVMGIDPRGAYEHLDLSPEGIRFLDLSPPFRSVNVRGRSRPVSLDEALRMSIPVTPAWSSDATLDALWDAGDLDSLLDALARDLDVLQAWYIYGRIHQCVRRGADDHVRVEWNLGREPTLSETLREAAEHSRPVLLSVSSKDPLHPLAAMRPFLPTEVMSWMQGYLLRGWWEDTNRADLFSIWDILAVLAP